MKAGDHLCVEGSVATGQAGTPYLASGNNPTVASQLTSASGELLIESVGDISQSATITNKRGDVGLIAGVALTQTTNGDIETDGDVLLEAGSDWTMAGDAMVSATGNVVGRALGGDIGLGVISGTNVALAASNSILDANAGLLNVTADNLSLRADSGLIGGSDTGNVNADANSNAIDITVSTLAVSSNSGVYLSETDDVTVTTVDAVAVDIESVVRVNFNST
ncbi:MAG: hypothetical protein GY877_05620, partial [Hyphomicrobium sp.]|nr:hypothetical protein [Hyphomicrobium sp.]